MTLNKSKYEGFTLIEILVVVGLIAVLAAVTIIALNPAKQFADTRNSTRRADVNTILNAVTQFTAEDGNTLSDLGTIPLCTDAPDEIGSAVGNVDLAAVLVDDFLVAIPVDPQSGTDTATGYTICQTDGGRVRVDATGENSAVISVTR